GAERCDAVFYEVETGAGHYVVLCVVRDGYDFLGNTKRGTDFGAGEFAVLKKLEIGAGEFGFDYFGAVPEEEWAVGDAGSVLSVTERRKDLILLVVIQRLVGTDDDAKIGVVFHEAVHEGGSGVVGFSSECGRREWGHAAPEVEGI